LNRKKRKLEVLEIAPPPPPKPPTKEEIKAQKKRDHQLLNLLKVQIQPIMDQIQKKYKKFRQAVIPQAHIQYLLDEMDPNFVRPDIPQFRPYEFDHDKDGVRGLRETATGKFFYNLETTTIEERLSNGFYARPKDYLADIRSLAKDSKHIGDKDRTLKANELLTNVEVDVAGIEAMPVFADCENLYQRQLQRAKERKEKEKKHMAEAAVLENPVGSDIPAGGLFPASQSGPLTLGEPIPGRRPPLTIAAPTPSGLSNGHSTSNGTSAHDNDIQMGGTDDHTQKTNEFSQPMQAPSQLRSMVSGPFSNPAPVSQISQRSAFQEIPHDASPSNLINDASTTTSGKKTSEGWSTQATNGVSHGQSSSPLDKAGSDSQNLPDTQQGPSARQSQQGGSDPSSEEQWPHSQAHGLMRGTLQAAYPSQTPSSSQHSQSQNPAVPPFNAPAPRPSPSKSKPAGIANLLNDSPVEPTSSQLSSQKDAIIDPYFLEDLYRRLVDGSSGCSIEQMEQLNRELMESLWAQRGEWNRNKVAATLVEVFNETIRDIEEMQKVLQASQPSQLVE